MNEPETPATFEAAPAEAPALRPNRKVKRTVRALMRHAKRKADKRTVRDARKLGLRGANGIPADYAGGQKRPTRSAGGGAVLT